MKYKDLMNEMYSFGKPKKKIVEVKKSTKKYTLSENIRKSTYYDNMTPMDRYNVDRYVGEEIKLFENNLVKYGLGLFGPKILIDPKL